MHYYPIETKTLKKILFAKKFIEHLALEGIEYNYCIKHKEVLGCDQSREYYQRFSYYIGNESEYCICKNLLVQERKGEKRKFLIIVSDEKQVDLKTLKDTYELKKLEFISQEDMEKFLHTEPGNVSLFNLQYDHENKLEVFFDEELLQEKQLAFHPLYNGMSLFLKPQEALKFVDSIGHSYKVISIPKKEEIGYKKQKILTKSI